MANGQLEPSMLKVLPGFQPYPGRTNFLAPSSATLSDLGTEAMYLDWMNLRAAFYARFGAGLYYAEAYRSLTMQQQRYREYQAGGPLAATPGTSNHGYAKAVDLRSNIDVWGSTERDWMVANGPIYGFTPIASEAWHWEHLSDGFVSAALTPASSGATPIGDDDMPLSDSDIANVKEAIFADLRMKTIINQSQNTAERVRDFTGNGDGGMENAGSVAKLLLGYKLGTGIWSLSTHIQRISKALGLDQTKP